MAVIRIPVDLRTPDFTTNTGNSFWTSVGLTAHDFGSWQYLPNVDGSVYGQVACPTNISGTPAAKIVLVLMANSTAGQVSSMNVLTAFVAPDGESMNPGSLTGVGVVDITMPTVAYETHEQTYTLASQPTADDIIIVEVFHDGNKAADTLAVNTILVEAFLEIDVA
jgi:hypothetical protein